MGKADNEQCEQSEARNLMIPCVLSLGSIGFSFEQLKRLHPGASIQFDTTSQLELTLSIGSTPFAEAIGTFSGGSAELVIQKLLGYPENSVGQTEIYKKLFSKFAE